MLRQYLGQCHCGKVNFKVEADLEGEQNLICNCTSCTMKGFIHHHVEKSRFNLTSGFDDLKLYKFGTLSAEHYFCKWCGVELFYRSRSDPSLWDINLRCLRDAATLELLDLYGLRYELHDGKHWDEAQTVRHAREKAGGIQDKARLWRLIAPDDAVAPGLDVATEFTKTWDDGAGLT